MPNVLSVQEIEVVQAILRYMGWYNTTPTLSWIAVAIHGDRSKRTGVHYHVQRLREKGVISDADALDGRIALVDPDQALKDIAHSLTVLGEIAERELEAESGSNVETD